MIWKTRTHEFSATVCQRTGKPCPALAQMARALTRAVASAGPAATPQFAVEGSSELAHCPEGCMARFHARPDKIRVFCGTNEETPGDRLEDYADMMFCAEFRALPSAILSDPPCAMLEASALAGRQVAAQTGHLSA